MLAFFATALTFAKRIPWQAWVALAIVAAILFAYRAGYNARDERADREMSEMLASVEAGQERARAAQQAALDAEQARYDELAERTDREYQIAQVEAMSAADRYITANRVRPPSGSVASPASAAPQGDGAGLPENLPADPFVAVSDADVRTCTVATTYAVEAFLWANRLADED